MPHCSGNVACGSGNQCHDRATLQGVRIPYAIFKIVFRRILFIFFVFNAVKASSGFCIVFDTLVAIGFGTRN